MEGRDTFRLRIARPPRRVNRRRRPPGMYGPWARTGVLPRGREYPLVQYGLIRNASGDVRIFRREGSKMVMTGALGLAGPEGATAELFFAEAIGWGLMRGRVGRGESSSYGKSSSSLKDPVGRGDPDIHYYTCLRFPFRPPHSYGPCKVSNEPGTGGGTWSLRYQQLEDVLSGTIFRSAKCVQRSGQCLV